MNLTENDYANIVIKHFDNNYTTYKEVVLSNGRKIGKFRCDIIAENSDERIAIEVKKSLNLKVIDQIFRWSEYVNKGYIAIPKKSYRQFKIAKSLAENFGFGIILICPRTKTIEIRVEACFNETPTDFKLYDEQKSSNAGTKEGGYITPFKITSNKLIEYIKENGKTYIKDVIKNIEHHYKTDKSAISSLQKMINQGVIKDVKIVKEKNKNYVTMY